MVATESRRKSVISQIFCRIPAVLILICQKKTERDKKEGSDAEMLQQNGGVVETGYSWLCRVSCCTHHEKCTPQNARSFVMEKSNAGIEKIKMMVILLRDQSPENAVIYNAQWTHSLHSHYEQ